MAKRFHRPGERPEADTGDRRPSKKRRFKPPLPPTGLSEDEALRLAVYIARCTDHTRRSAGDIVKAGRVMVNGEPELHPGREVLPQDVVQLDGERLQRRDRTVYILVNKPRDVVARTDGGEGAPDLSSILKFDGANQLGVSRPLRSEDLGLQLITNDEALIRKYDADPPLESWRIELAEEPAMGALERIREQPAVRDAMPADPLQPRILQLNGRGLEPVKLLADLGMEVLRVDRLSFASLTKKDLPRGHWRYLNDKEVVFVTKLKQ